MLCLGGFELYSRWVPLKHVSCEAEHFYERATEQGSNTRRKTEKSNRSRYFASVFQQIRIKP